MFKIEFSIKKILFNFFSVWYSAPAISGSKMTIFTDYVLMEESNVFNLFRYAV